MPFPLPFFSCLHLLQPPRRLSLETDTRLDPLLLLVFEEVTELLDEPDAPPAVGCNRNESEKLAWLNFWDLLPQAADTDWDLDASVTFWLTTVDDVDEEDATLNTLWHGLVWPKYKFLSLSFEEPFDGFLSRASLVSEQWLVTELPELDPLHTGDWEVLLGEGLEFLFWFLPEDFFWNVNQAFNKLWKHNGNSQ